MTPPTPRAAVVLPWGGGRPDLLAAQIRCLIGQDLEAPLQIRIAVNDRAATGAAAELLGMASPSREIRIVDASQRPGPAHARNAGAAAGACDVLLFCDADDEVDEHWARRMIGGLGPGGADLVGGRLSYERLNPVRFVLSPAEGLPVAFGHLAFTPSASLGIRSAVFARLGGFDVDLLSGEDIDLCWRTQGDGCSLAFVSDAVVHYRLRQTASALFAQGRAYGLSDVQLYRKHRGAGLRRGPAATANELARLVALAVLAPFRSGGRLKLALKAGTIVGHVRGSVRWRQYFV